MVIVVTSFDLMLDIFIISILFLFVFYILLKAYGLDHSWYKNKSFSFCFVCPFSVYLIPISLYFGIFDF